MHSHHVYAALTVLATKDTKAENYNETENRKQKLLQSIVVCTFRLYCLARLMCTTHTHICIERPTL